MAQVQTLLNLRGMVRRYADMRVANQFVLDADVDALVNECCAKYYGLLVALHGHAFFETELPIAVISGTSSYALPDTLFELSTVTLEWGGREHERCSPIGSNRDLSNYANLDWSRGAGKGYRLSGTQSGVQTLSFYPAPSGAVTARIRYVPHFVPMVAPGGTIVVFNGWDSVVALDGAIRLRGMADLPTRNLEGLFDRELQQLNELATERLADEPAQIVEVDSGWSGAPFGRRYARGF